MTWKEDALCAQVDPELWFPEKGMPTTTAKTMCNRCPVTTECLEAALDRDEKHGVWGGHSERERRKIKHNRRQTSTTNTKENTP